MKKIMRSKSQIALLTILLLMACILFTSLSLAGEKVEPSEDEAEIKEEKVIETPEDYDASNILLVSAIQDKNIYLYGIKPEGAVLYVDGTGHYYDWIYLTPRFILPRMYTGDYDYDGKEELAIILYVGSGTGCAIEELHIVEIYEDKVLSLEPTHEDYLKPNPKYFKDHAFFSEDYISKLNEIVKIEVPEKNDEWVANISVSNKMVTANLKECQSEDMDAAIESKPCFGDIVHFNVVEGKLTARFELGINIDTIPIPIFVGAVLADVIYKESDFTLSNVRFELDEAYAEKNK